ncbi:MAG: ATP-binding cassette domain-containing protein, partial [Promethearchaeota archaeon]
MLEVDKLDASYGQIKVLKDVSLKVGDGELVVLIGPNGHGKSTLLKTICGLHPPTSGH